MSPLMTYWHLSQRRLRMPVRKYHPKTDGLKVAFFNDDEETPSTPKADALFVPRENPRALVIRPLGQWHSRSGMAKTMANGTPVHENGCCPKYYTEQGAGGGYRWTTYKMRKHVIGKDK
ncbi:hypothetical protein OROMI_006112 [Orobanche minor]